MRRWLKWLLGLTLGISVLLGVVLSWLLYTQSGLAWALRSGLASGDGRIEYAALRGSLSAGFELDAPQVDLPGLRINADQLRLRLRLSALWHGELIVELLHVDGARHTVLPSDAPPSPASRPGRLDLPIDVVLQDIALVGTQLNLGGEQPLVFSVGASEIALRAGKLQIAGLAFSQGDLALRASAAVDTTADWSGEFASEGEWTLPSVLHRGRLRLQGDLDALDMELALEGGGQLSLDANFARPLDAPGIEGQLGAVQLDLSSFGLDAPIRMLDLDLRFVWAEGKLGVSGPVSVDGRALNLALTGLEFAPQELRIERFDVQSPEVGRLSVAGHWPTAASAPAGALRIDLDELWAGDWRGAKPAPAPQLSGQLDLNGRSDDWQLALEGTWHQGEPSGPLRLRASGTPGHIIIAPSEIGLQQSLVTFSGQIDTGETTTLGLDLTARAFDPALIDAAWPGKLDAQLRIEAQLAKTQTWHLAINEVSGELRAAALRLTGEVSGTHTLPETGQLDLRWGDAQVQARIGAGLAFSAELSALELGLLGPLQGKVSGQFATRLDGDPIESTTAEIEIDDFVAGNLSSRRLRVSKRASWDFDLSADQLLTGAAAFSAVSVAVDGTAAAHQAQIKAAETRGLIELGVSGAYAADTASWTGRVERVELAPIHGAAWSLADSAALSVAADRISLTPLCLQAAAARACIGAEKSAATSTLRIDLQALPLADLQAWAPASEFTAQGLLSGGGELTLDAELVPSGTLDFRIEDGILRGGAGLDQPLAFTAALGFDGANSALSANLQLAEHGSIDARAVGFGQADGQVSVRLALTDLSFVDGLSAEIQGMRGALSGELSAPIADPSKLLGSVSSSALQFELPVLGLKASAGMLAVEFTGDGLLRLDGSVDIAPGKLRFDGQLGLGDGDLSLINIRGDNAGLVDLPAVRLAGDTNFQIKRGPDGFEIVGGVLLRSGKIDLDRFTPAFPASEDVVIEDAPPPPAALPITADISVAMIQAVDLRGFGIEATLNGGVHITQTPGAQPRGKGEMLIKGIYNAYGQKLDIERGRLGFTSRVDNPSLDILAVKRVDRQRIGVQVRGNAQRPAIRLYSDPSLDQSETLSYLVLGRPLATASGADSEQLGQYASALETAGGSLVAGSIGKKLGLAAGVESFGSAIGSALVVGKYLSPRFFIGYGTSLLDATQLVILRFRVTENIDIEGISGAEQKVSVSWRTER